MQSARSHGAEPSASSAVPGNDSRQRSTAILQSLCAGYFQQLASAADPTDSKAGFWLVEVGVIVYICKLYRITPWYADLEAGRLTRSPDQRQQP